jgi:hypothetical protein
MEETVSLALGEMRIVRGLKSYEENDFEIFKSDGIIEFLKENTVKLRAATIAIGLITLLGAAIGLMNIMLVSVTERTKEIGIAKALGATKRWILFQFMFEAIIVCMLGGILGICTCHSSRKYCDPHHGREFSHSMDVDQPWTSSMHYRRNFIWIIPSIKSGLLGSSRSLAL